MCFCGSGIEFSLCCAPVIQHSNAQTPEQLMRSRFSAYCAVQADYLEQTWHPSLRSLNTVTEIEQFARSVHFVKLHIVSTSPQAPAAFTQPESGFSSSQLGYVEFIASFIANDRRQSLHEISRFVREDDRWYYLDGSILPSGSEKLGRNDPCPCQSGLKYKSCKAHKKAC